MITATWAILPQSCDRLTLGVGQIGEMGTFIFWFSGI